MRTLRLAVVGTGSEPGARARQYLNTITNLRAYFEFAAVCDIDEERGRQAAEAYGAGAYYRCVTDMLDTERPDLLLCLTPTDSQHVMALTAAEYGCHVITEIPMGITLSVGDAVAAAFRERGLKWEVAEQVWLWPKEQLKRKIIEAGLIGTVTHARLQYFTGAYHGFNGLRMLIGTEPKRIMGFARQVKTEPYISYGGEPFQHAVLEHAVIEFDGGVPCIYDKPPCAFPKRSCPQFWDVMGTDGYLKGDELIRYEADGEKRYPIRQTHETIEGEDVLSSLFVETEPRVRWENPFYRESISSPDNIAKASILVGMHRAIVEDREPQYGAANARRDLELCFAVHESESRGNTWVELPLGTEPTETENQIHEAYREAYGQHPLGDISTLRDAVFTRKGVWWRAVQWL